MFNLSSSICQLCSYIFGQVHLLKQTFYFHRGIFTYVTFVSVSLETITVFQLILIFFFCCFNRNVEVMAR